jgi:hypothetical protein
MAADFSPVLRERMKELYNEISDLSTNSFILPKGFAQRSAGYF